MVIEAARQLLRRKNDPASGVLVGGRMGKRIRLSWVWSTDRHPDANLGDALSAVIVSAISGLGVERTAFNNAEERLAAIGTIGHAQRGSTIHLWGTGFDLGRHVDGTPGAYAVPEDTTLVVHGVRGRRTAEGLRARGLTVPDVFGDPAWFLPRIFPFKDVQKSHDLGVIVHISELEDAVAGALVRATIERYKLPPEMADRIRIINTYCAADMAGMEDKLREIVSCRRILSTSLHGLVIAETYGIPCAWFCTAAGEPGDLPFDGPVPIDHRMADFYSGAGREAVLIYLQPLAQPTDWAAAMAFIDTHWRPLDYTGQALFDAFPLAKAVKFKQAVWPLPKAVLDSNRY
ncbi:hypothetical protein BJF93_03015 [Xaviernesmea oryzae]|uniref:Polysaccharide pyruvyl transferase domain-containing protein n=1 Tax=Xaviernesmea oryzae TaxID=464029 RepID=A0A1Q9AZC5_9HYPH|nr:polysaccharide pyruvyl transferase family protein [Xaviernesmea oryzae]OLP61045.1 hypothetical protein BJF93_03015 [Xaviernesmea oryzae]SEL15843.1 Polysaccharide pyruvyl transferase [Xaviernesmea oryzae]